MTLKVWELMAELSKMPASATISVMVSSSLWVEADRCEKIDDETFGIVGGDAMIVDGEGNEKGTTSELAEAE